jgi:hypothetical protein
MPEPVEWNVASQVQTIQRVFRAAGRHHAVLTDMSDHLGMGERCVRTPPFNLQFCRIDQQHRDAPKPKAMRDGQAVVPVDHDEVLAVNDHTGPHGTPANVHVRALLDPIWVCGLMRVKLAEVDQSGTKLHAMPSVRCDKDMSSRRRT